MVKKEETNPRDRAYLVGFDADGTKVFEDELTLYQYYDEPHEAIDSNQFRKDLKIVRILGRLYDSQGKLAQEFENEYGVDGSLVHQKTRFEDGTVTEF